MFLEYGKLKKKSFSKTPHLIYDKLDNNRKLEFSCTEKENKTKWQEK